ncbi:MAG: 30S ribosomal protein S1 [Candidatus Marinimicrobia bacterium]|nr:30S ribosomal protein S1 [Candidatus Neomarinimicrobiota bacterium]
MSTDIQQETQEVENTESTEVADTISATEDIKETTKTQSDKEGIAKEDESGATKENVPDIVAEEELEVAATEEEYIPPPVAVLDYLDPSILDVKVVTEEDLDKYEEEEFVPDELHDQYADTFSDIKEREVVTGTVVGLTDRDVLVDIGFKAEGIIHRSEFEELPEIGHEIDVFIITFEDRRGNIILSKERADFQRRWTEIRNCFEKEELITGLISRRIKGGMVVDLGVVQAFLPGSQVDIKPVMDFDEFLGVESEFKIVKFNELRQNIVLSRKAILEDDLLGKRQAVLEEMEIGMVLEGTVKNITDFGAFVDLGGIDGLLHITDITWGRINHPTDRLAIGEQVTVKVIDFDIEKVRVSLGMKQLQPEPWQGIDEKYPIDSIIEGKIVNMMNYGAFIQLEEGVEGLIHISEMSWTRHIKHPSDMFKVGDKVEAKILNIDTDEKKISLGIKQLQDNPWDTIESKFEVGSDHDGIVRNLTQFGAFIELEEGIDGLVHVSDMSWVKQVRHPKEIVQKGDTIKVRILEVSAEDRRLALGIKQIEANPWENIKNDFTSGKVVNGTILKVLDKGIIFDLGEGLEGIVPLKRMKKHEKNSILTNFKEGDSHEVTVQEVDEEYKKIILMMDLGLDGLEGDDEQKPEMVVDEAEPEKLEIPQEIIDQISENDEENDSEDPPDEKSDDEDSVDEQ